MTATSAPDRRSNAGMLAGLGLATLILLSACSSLPGGQGARPAQDGPPPYREGMDQIPDAIPSFEPVTVAGNKSPYTIDGRRYKVQSVPYGYRQTGLASWYGTRFHGERTANGEEYDVYGMTAAHRSLPIPCFLRVTNLENGRSVVVRVNDRGPFDDDLMVDLSYAAAWRLGYAEQGTARVEIELLDPGAPEWVEARAAAQSTDSGATRMWLQTGAFSTLERAQRVQAQLEELTDEAVVISTVSIDQLTLYRVRIGPISDPQVVYETQRDINEAKLGDTQIVRE